MDSFWYTISNTFRYTNDGEGGDSGGPVYYDDGANLFLIGMHFGSGDVFGGGRQGYACRIQNVMSALNVTPITNESFNTVNLSGSTLCLNSINFNPTGGFNIPSSIMGKSVAQIGNAAFAYQGNISSTTIPASVTSIGTETFKNCSSMTNFYFESNSQLTSIGNAAFYNCGSLSSIIIPTRVTGIGANSFENCYSLTNLSFETNSFLTDIGNSAFANCGRISTITLSSGVSRIGTNTFQGCSYLSKVSLPSNSSLAYIENAAFYGCGSLSKINLSANITSIGYDAFSSCSVLESITIPNSTSFIGGNAFANCSNLTVYTLKVSVPSGWISNWNSSNRPVVWSCTLSSDNSYVISFIKSATNPSNSNAANGITNPYRKDYNFGGWYTTSDFSGTQYMNLATAPNGTLYAKWNASSCVAEGTLVTLADGSHVAVEDLTGEELLLVWNLSTGTFDVAPILFIDSDSHKEYEIIHLYFSDSTEVKVISEHAFWDIDLNEFVFLRNDAVQYIGHWFNKQTDDGNDNMVWTAVQLVDVDVYMEYTTAWSPVTFGHLCYYVNGMLSMPGATEGFINIFEVDAATMQYDATSFAADIATYGLFTYEEFAEIFPIPEVVFDAFNGQYLKVSIGKGLIDYETIGNLIMRYAGFFE